ncbi:hypothetical protein ACQKNC_16395 [Lysinibacillus sp. NPDC094177]
MKKLTKMAPFLASAMYKAMDKVSEGLASDVKGALLDFLGITAVMAACFE